MGEWTPPHDALPFLQLFKWLLCYVATLKRGGGMLHIVFIPTHCTAFLKSPSGAFRRLFKLKKFLGQFLHTALKVSGALKWSDH